jgi:hypothetical protein
MITDAASKDQKKQSSGSTTVLAVGMPLLVVYTVWAFYTVLKKKQMLKKFESLDFLFSKEHGGHTLPFLVFIRKTAVGGILSILYLLLVVFWAFFTFYR